MATKIKLKEERNYPHDPAKSQWFMNLFNHTQTDISDNNLDSEYEIEILNDKGSKPQNWIVRFKGKNDTPYEGKQISGILSFPNNYPQAFPQFHFDKIKPEKKYQGTKLGFPFHENIYGDGLLCIPLLSEKLWKPNNPIKPLDMIIAISNIFHNPTDNDKANVSFPTDQKLIDEARKQLAEALDEPSF